MRRTNNFSRLKKRVDAAIAEVEKLEIGSTGRKLAIMKYDMEQFNKAGAADAGAAEATEIESAVVSDATSIIVENAEGIGRLARSAALGFRAIFGWALAVLQIGIEVWIYVVENNGKTGTQEFHKFYDQSRQTAMNSFYHIVDPSRSVDEFPDLKCLGPFDLIDINSKLVSKVSQMRMKCSESGGYCETVHYDYNVVPKCLAGNLVGDKSICPTLKEVEATGDDYPEEMKRDMIFAEWNEPQKKGYCTLNCCEKSGDPVDSAIWKYFGEGYVDCKGSNVPCYVKRKRQFRVYDLRCPSGFEVAATPKSKRKKLWEDKTKKHGCTLATAECNDEEIPCQVKRTAVNFRCPTRNEMIEMAKNGVAETLNAKNPPPLVDSTTWQNFFKDWRKGWKYVDMVLTLGLTYLTTDECGRLDPPSPCEFKDNEYSDGGKKKTFPRCTRMVMDMEESFYEY